MGNAELWAHAQTALMQRAPRPYMKVLAAVQKADMLGQRLLDALLLLPWCLLQPAQWTNVRVACGRMLYRSAQSWAECVGRPSRRLGVRAVTPPTHHQPHCWQDQGGDHATLNLSCACPAHDPPKGPLGIHQEAKAPTLIHRIVPAGLIKARPLDEWRETVAILASFGSGDEWPGLCDALARRLASGGLRHAATLCWICAGNVQLAVQHWLATAGPSGSLPTPALQVSPGRLACGPVGTPVVLLLVARVSRHMLVTMLGGVG